jgi:hypothetical protein
MEWIDRALVVSPYCYGLCLSEADFKRQLKRLNVPRDDWPSFLGAEGGNATAHFFESAHGLCAIVTLGGTNGKSIQQVHAMLVHEAVHIWQAIREHLGEKSPSSEFEAYSVQTISQRLMESYERARKSK